MKKLSKSMQGDRKPSWDVAPEWASFIAMDKDGEWCWHETEPYLDHWEYVWCSDGNQTHASTEINPEKILEWKESVERRPCADIR